MLVFNTLSTLATRIMRFIVQQFMFPNDKLKVGLQILKDLCNQIQEN